MKQLLALTVLSSLAMGIGYSATVIAPVSVTAAIAGDAGSHANFLISDNSSLVAATLQDGAAAPVLLPTGTDMTVALATYHYRASDGHIESWTKDNPASLPTFVFDLAGGADTDIASIILWQYGNNGGSANVNDSLAFSLIFHTAAEGSTFDFGTETVEFNDAMVSVGDALTDNVAQNFGFATESAAYVGLRLDTSNGGSRFGLGEVRFSIPEPSSSLLGGFGLLALLRRRR